MWSITNHTPYKVGKTWGRDKEGFIECIVAIKANYYILLDDSVKLAEEQLEPLLEPEYNGVDGVSSLRYEAVLVVLKPTINLLTNGSAYDRGNSKVLILYWKRLLGAMREQCDLITISFTDEFTGLVRNFGG